MSKFLVLFLIAYLAMYSVVSVASGSSGGVANQNYDLLSDPKFWGALAAIIIGQAVLPAWRFYWSNQRKKKVLYRMILSHARKTLDFFGETHAGIPASIDSMRHQINRMKSDAKYMAYVTVADNHDLTDILDDHDFWLLDEEVVGAFVDYLDDIEQTKSMSEKIYDEKYQDLIGNDRERLINAIEQLVNERMTGWYDSTLKLKKVVESVTGHYD